MRNIGIAGLSEQYITSNIMCESTFYHLYGPALRSMSIWIMPVDSEHNGHNMDHLFNSDRIAPRTMFKIYMDCSVNRDQLVHRRTFTILWQFVSLNGANFFKQWSPVVPTFFLLSSFTFLFEDFYYNMK